MKIQLCITLTLIALMASCVSPSSPSSAWQNTSTPEIITVPTATVSIFPTSTSVPIIVIQEENPLPQIKILPKTSQQLENNYIGQEEGSYEDGYGHPEYILDPGYKWVRISSNTDSLNWQRAEITPGNFEIIPAVDNVISNYANNGITILLNLGVGDGENRPDTTRFKNEKDIEHYLNYVRYMVQQFKGRIKYYEIWNEPNVPAPDSPFGQIAFSEYIHLVKQVVPVIREVDPEARIVVGAVSGKWTSGYPGYGEWARHTFDVEFLQALTDSDVMPLVDAISWHPFYCIRADDPYYQNYPQMVKEIKERAREHGFKGEFIAEEISWRTPDSTGNSDLQPFSEIIVTKYFIRSVVIHRGLDVMVGISMGESSSSSRTPSRDQSIMNLNTIMAGTLPTSEQMKIQINPDSELEIEHYSFSLPNGDKLLAIWTDGLPVEDDPGSKMDVIIENPGTMNVVAFDVLYGVQQQLNWQQESSDIHIPDLRLRDYPLFILLSH